MIVSLNTSPLAAVIASIGLVLAYEVLQADFSCPSHQLDFAQFEELFLRSFERGSFDHTLKST